MSQAQLRSKSERPAAEVDGETVEGNSRAGDSGRDQVTVAGAMREIWFWKEKVGAVDTGDGSGKERFAAQQALFMPQWQEAVAFATLASAVGAEMRLAQASNRLQTTASA
ncbi:MAG TPA: hypothetical protein VGF90_07855, partial [Verrucomicrobiae bacterium]